MKIQMKLCKSKRIRAVLCMILALALILCFGNFGDNTIYGNEEKTEAMLEESLDTESSADAEAAIEPMVIYEEDAVAYAIGTVNAINVFIRNEAGTVGTYKVTALNTGHTVDVIDEKIVDDVVWYKVNCTNGGENYTGWVHGAYLDVVKINVETDEDFEQSLRDAGFPESYVEKLAILHTKYPNWTFVPVQTGLEWDVVIAAESKAAVNLVQTSADDAKKSIAASEYNWYTDKWTIRDGSGWVTAHPDYIAYCMDPRNYLTETTIFQFESLSYSSIQNEAGVEAILKGSFMENSITDADETELNYASAFVSIGKETGVSPYHLASRVLQEQGDGTSPLISGKYKGYKGYFNFFNVNAFGSPEAVLYANGLSYAKNNEWNTRYASILGGAKLLANNYIAKGQDSLYFQKFNVVYSEKLFAHQYMANVTAAITEGQKIAKAYTDKTQSFVFRIPVYLNMPEEAVQFTASGNPNNYLSALGVSGLSITPSFSADVTEYSIIVDPAVSSITVSAAPVSSKATISGTGAYSLETGNNIVKVKCKSQSGKVRTYTLTVVKPEEMSENYTVTSEKYTIGDYITGVAPETKAADFLANVACEGTTLAVLNAKGEANTGMVGTGSKLAIYKEGTLVSTKDIVVYGDVNGDAGVNVLDIIKINRQVIGLEKLSGAYLEAGDANRKADGMNVLDLIVVNRHILGLTTIQQ